jgi:hypothetical protein
MTDVSAVIMAATNPHALRAADEAFRWRQGEFVAVHPYSAERGRSDNPRFHLLHVTACPGTFESVKAFLLADHAEADFPGARGIEPGKAMARRKRRLDIGALPPRLCRTLEITRELEISWNSLTGPGGLSIGAGGFCRERAAGERPMKKEDR